MNDMIWRIAGFTLLLLWRSLAAAQPIHITDDMGSSLELPRPAQRIISLAPHITELLFKVGAGAQIVGVVSYSDYPPAAKQLPQVGGYEKFDVEAVLRLQPDLLVAWHSGNPAPELTRLRELGIPLYVNEPRRLEDVASSMENLGLLTGHVSESQTAANEFRQHLLALDSANQDKAPIKVFYQVWHQPLITLNGEHLISDVIHRCGGMNVFANSPSLVPRVSVEAVLTASPEVIITGQHGSLKSDQLPESLQTWANWPDLPATHLQALFTMNSDLINRHSPRILEGMQIICDLLDEARSLRKKQLSKE